MFRQLHLVNVQTCTEHENVIKRVTTWQWKKRARRHLTWQFESVFTIQIKLLSMSASMVFPKPKQDRVDIANTSTTEAIVEVTADSSPHLLLPLEKLPILQRVLFPYMSDIIVIYQTNQKHLARISPLHGRLIIYHLHF